MATWLFVLVFGIASVCRNVDTQETTLYDNHALIQLSPLTEVQLRVLHKLEDPHLEILKKSRALNDTTDILVSPSRRQALQDFAAANNLTLHIKRENYGRTFEPVQREARRRLRSFNVFGYNSFSAIQEYIETVALRYPQLVTLQTLGNSYQGRRLKLVKISSSPRKGNPIIFIDAGIHAREWVAPALALYIIHRLVTDPEARKNDLNGVDWYILPVVNPDGYEFTRTNRANRLWRKTRSFNGIENCFGVDGNRNYGYKWGVSGVSNNPCDKETYAGPQPFSEPETQIVRNVMMENAKRMKLYVSLHAYGNYLVYPWGYTGDHLPKDWKKLDDMARLVSEAVRRAGGKPFKVLSAGKWYPAAGGSDDYAFGAVGVPYSYTMELTDDHEFQFPEYMLRVVLPQFYEGFRASATQIRKEFGSLRMKKDIKENASSVNQD